jgi:hypothetical protein
MSNKTKRYCLVTDTGKKYHSKSVKGVLTDYVTDPTTSLSEVFLDKPSRTYKYCVVSKDTGTKFFGNTLTELLTDVTYTRLSNLFAGKGLVD